MDSGNKISLCNFTTFSQQFCFFYFMLWFDDFFPLFFEIFSFIRWTVATEFPSAILQLFHNNFAFSISCFYLTIFFLRKFFIHELGIRKKSFVRFFPAAIWQIFPKIYSADRTVIYFLLWFHEFFLFPATTFFKIDLFHAFISRVFSSQNFNHEVGSRKKSFTRRSSAKRSFGSAKKGFCSFFNNLEGLGPK